MKYLSVVALLVASTVGCAAAPEPVTPRTEPIAPIAEACMPTAPEVTAYDRLVSWSQNYLASRGWPEGELGAVVLTYEGAFIALRATPQNPWQTTKLKRTTDGSWRVDPEPLTPRENENRLAIATLREHLPDNLVIIRVRVYRADSELRILSFDLTETDDATGIRNVYPNGPVTFRSTGAGEPWRLDDGQTLMRYHRRANRFAAFLNQQRLALTSVDALDTIAEGLLVEVTSANCQGETASRALVLHGDGSQPVDGAITPFEMSVSAFHDAVNAAHAEAFRSHIVQQSSQPLHRLAQQDEWERWVFQIAGGTTVARTLEMKRVGLDPTIASSFAVRTLPLTKEDTDDLLTYTVVSLAISAAGGALESYNPRKGWTLPLGAQRSVIIEVRMATGDGSKKSALLTLDRADGSPPGEVGSWAATWGPL